MQPDMKTLCGAAAAVGFLHTLLGPDHYLPFAAIARARSWSLGRTITITVLCGLGHVLGSILLGLLGLALGVTIFRVESIESTRCELAGWLLLIFGAVYFVWGVRRAIRRKPHTHAHAHANGTMHSHEHAHEGRHVHIHDGAVEEKPASAPYQSLIPWTMFVVLVFGPCEPLIPFLMYPAATGRMGGVVLVTVIFSLTTIATMTMAVVATYIGFGALPISRLERFSHALAGFTILVCGIAVKAGM